MLKAALDEYDRKQKIQGKLETARNSKNDAKINEDAKRKVIQEKLEAARVEIKRK